jgi:hypothetical protein
MKKVYLINPAQLSRYTSNLEIVTFEEDLLLKGLSKDLVKHIVIPAFYNEGNDSPDMLYAYFSTVPIFFYDERKSSNGIFLHDSNIKSKKELSVFETVDAIADYYAKYDQDMHNLIRNTFDLFCLQARHPMDKVRHKEMRY